MFFCAFSLDLPGNGLNIVGVAPGSVHATCTDFLIEKLLYDGKAEVTGSVSSFFLGE
jgi:hypothetical protein